MSKAPTEILIIIFLSKEPGGVVLYTLHLLYIFVLRVFKHTFPSAVKVKQTCNAPRIYNIIVTNIEI